MRKKKGFSIAVFFVGFVVLVLGYEPVLSQHLTLLSIDTTNFPQMRSRIFLNADNEGSRELPYLQLFIRDNAVSCQATFQPVPYSTMQRASSVMICTDISQSTENSPESRNLLHLAARTIAENITSRSTELGLTFFDNHAHIACDLTTDRKAFLDGFKKQFVGRSTNYEQAFLQPRTGALEFFAPESKNNVMVLITDGFDSLDVDRVVRVARSQNCTIFALCIGGFTSSTLEAIATQSGGHCFSHRDDSLDVRDAAATIGGILSGLECLDIVWTSGDLSSEHHTVSLNLPTSNRSLMFDYNAPQQKRAVLEHPSHLSFGRVPPSKPSSAMVALHAVNYDIRIDSIEFEGMPFFSTGMKFPLTVKAFTTENIPIAYAPKDSGFCWGRLVMHSVQNGRTTVSMSGGFQGYPAAGSSLRILKPTDGQLVATDTYVPIEWEGCAPEDYSRVELSLDGGANWKVIQENVRGNLYMMRTPRDLSSQCKVRVTQKAAMTNGSQGIQVETSPTFSLFNPNSLCSDIRMNPTAVGERKDKTFDTFIKNTTGARLRVESVEIIGDHPQDFVVCSQAPPYTLNPGETHPLELSFRPSAAGLRSARVNMKTAFGYANVRVTGFGVDTHVQTKPSMLDFGIVQTGDSVTFYASASLINKSDSPLQIHRMFLIGPDTTQFVMNTALPTAALQPHANMPLSFTFRPTAEGRTSSQAVFVTDVDDSPHILQLYGQGATHMKDPTSFREVVSPTAITPRAGTLVLGDIDLLGVVGYYGLTDNIMLQVGGVIPVPLSHRSTLVYSAGIKAGLPIMKNLNIAGGYQYVHSRSDLSTTDAIESDVSVHAPYAVVSYGNDDARASVSFGYAFKHHVTIDEPEGFDADATLGALSGDIRVGGRWKICAEAYSFRNLGYVPVVATARYIGGDYTVDFGASYLGFTTGTTQAPKFPFVPVIGIMWVL